MKYIIEFDLPDNETVCKEIKTEPIKWAVWGYSGYAFAKPVRIKAPLIAEWVTHWMPLQKSPEEEA